MLLLFSKDDHTFSKLVSNALNFVGIILCESVCLNMFKSLRWEFLDRAKADLPWRWGGVLIYELVMMIFSNQVQKATCSHCLCKPKPGLTHQQNMYICYFSCIIPWTSAHFIWSSLVSLITAIKWWYMGLISCAKSTLLWFCLLTSLYIGLKFKIIAQGNISSHQTHHTENTAGLCFSLYPACSEKQAAGHECWIK